MPNNVRTGILHRRGVHKTFTRQRSGVDIVDSPRVNAKLLYYMIIHSTSVFIRRGNRLAYYRASGHDRLSAPSARIEKRFVITYTDTM